LTVKELLEKSRIATKRHIIPIQNEIDAKQVIRYQLSALSYDGPTKFCAGQVAFPYLEQVFLRTRHSAAVKTGKISEQTIYGITSLAVEEFGAAEL
jgi:hypothetical protein